MASKQRKQALPDDCMPKCATCAFFNKEPKDEIGLCRRYPPVVLIINDEPEMIIPATTPEDWCGEFRRKTS